MPCKENSDTMGLKVGLMLLQGITELYQNYCKASSPI